MLSEYKFSSKDREFQIIQCLGRVQLNFNNISKELQKDIENRIRGFYNEKLNSQVQPKVLFACLVDYYRTTSKIIVTKARIIEIFAVSQHWINKSRKQYLEDMGLTLSFSFY